MSGKVIAPPDRSASASVNAPAGRSPGFPRQGGEGWLSGGRPAGQEHGRQGGEVVAELELRTLARTSLALDGIAPAFACESLLRDRHLHSLDDLGRTRRKGGGPTGSGGAAGSRTSWRRSGRTLRAAALAMSKNAAYFHLFPSRDTLCVLADHDHEALAGAFGMQFRNAQPHTASPARAIGGRGRFGQLKGPKGGNAVSEDRRACPRVSRPRTSGGSSQAAIAGLGATRRVGARVR